jgi:hypothetical protein
VSDDFYIEDPESDEQIVVATAEFCVIFGGCAECPGWGTVEQLRSRSKDGNFEPDLPANQIVFCTHWCHLDAAET